MLFDARSGLCNGRPGRVLQRPVELTRLRRQQRAVLIRVTAYRNHQVGLVQHGVGELRGRLRGDVDAQLIHGCDGPLVLPVRLNTGGLNNEIRACHIPGKAFRHLRLAGAAGAEKQDVHKRSLLPIQSQLIAGRLGMVARRWRTSSRASARNTASSTSRAHSGRSGCRL